MWEGHSLTPFDGKVLTRSLWKGRGCGRSRSDGSSCVRQWSLTLATALSQPGVTWDTPR